MGDLAVGARFDDDGGPGHGAVWVLFLDGAVAPDCPWDLNDDNLVGTTDLLLLLGAWGKNPGHPADFNSDGLVGASDLIALLGNWGPCP